MKTLRGGGKLLVINKLPKIRFPEFSGEWQEKTLGEVVVSESSNLTLNKLKLKEEGNPVYGADNIVGYLDTYQHKEEYISIVKDGSGVGRIRHCKKNSSILGTQTALKSKDKNKFLLDWIFYLLNTINFSSYVKGSGIPHIYYSDYKNEKILLPPTLEEQQKIANCLTSLDEIIETQNQNIENLKTHKKGLLQQLFPSVA